MIKPQDIDLKELRFIRFKIPYTGTTGYNVKQFLADKLNRIEKEIDESKERLCFCYSENKDKEDEECVSCSLIRMLKPIIRKEFTAK